MLTKVKRPMREQNENFNEKKRKYQTNHRTEEY